jgi:hypothetical protein
MTMTDFLPLRALVWRRRDKADALPKGPLRDPLGDAITSVLREADLWRDTGSMTLETLSGRLCIRVHLPARQVRGRDTDQETAQSMRSVIAHALRLAGYSSIFTDALWNEATPQGWSVVASARPQSAGAGEGT